jgi:hypothetical protein
MLGMTQHFVACDRDQELLLPPNLRDWLPEGHFADFLLDAVEEMNLDGFYAVYRADGHGRPAYEPAYVLPEAPVPDHPNLRTAPDRPSTQQFHAAKRSSRATLASDAVAGVRSGWSGALGPRPTRASRSLRRGDMLSAHRRSLAGSARMTRAARGKQVSRLRT